MQRHVALPKIAVADYTTNDKVWKYFFARAKYRGLSLNHFLPATRAGLLFLCSHKEKVAKRKCASQGRSLVVAVTLRPTVVLSAGKGTSLFLLPAGAHPCAPNVSFIQVDFTDNNRSSSIEKIASRFLHARKFCKTLINFAARDIMRPSSSFTKFIKAV